MNTQCTQMGEHSAVASQCTGGESSIGQLCECLRRKCGHRGVTEAFIAARFDRATISQVAWYETSPQ